jgi:GNAT superfamily N-acetyltransferase
VEIPSRQSYAMFTKPKLVVTDVHDADARATILEGIAKANRAHVHEPGLRRLDVLVKQPWSGKVVGGLFGRTAWDWLKIELLYISPELRGGGWGQRIIGAAEEEAVRRNCWASWAAPFSFQAVSFYERMGYTPVGTLEDYPTGHQRIFLQKMLVDRDVTPSSAIRS